MEKKKGILVVSFGTSHLDTMEKTIVAIENEIQETFPEYQVYRAFTSGMILKKLQKMNGLVYQNVQGALEQMASDGIEQVIVQPTHIINGFEYDKMREEMSGFEDKFQNIRAGKPLLSTADDYKKAVHAVMEDAELEKEEALVLMGHGTEHHANSAYPALEYTAHLLGYRQVIVGTVEGFPDLSDVITKLEIGNLKKALLMPFMVVAGDHAKNDMAGDEDSWKQKLEKAGYEVRTAVKGLGEIKGIRKIFIEHVREAM